MLTKLAIQNIRRSKGYFIAYILTVAVFFTIVYQTKNIEEQLKKFLVDKVSAQDVKISDMFLYLKYFLYLIILFFAAYVSHFFIKRRSKEVALLKTLGLNRRNIWYIFLIENAIVVVAGLIIGLVSGILFSRIIAIVAFEIIGLKFTSVNFAMMTTGLFDVGLIGSIVYIIISYIPLKIISKTSIVELLKNQVSNEKKVKKSWLSLSIFIISLVVLLYLIIIYIPNPKLMLSEIDLLIYFISAILVAYFLYRGAMSFFFSNYQTKHSGINSPVRLLSLNHLASNFAGVIRMMSIITIISAIVSMGIVASFGFFNTYNNQTIKSTQKKERSEDQEIPSFYVKFISNNKQKSRELYKKVLKIDSQAKQYNLYNFGKPQLKGNEKNLEKEISNVIAIKQSDYDSLEKSAGVKTKIKSNQFIASWDKELLGDLNSKENYYIRKMLSHEGINPNQLVSESIVVHTLNFMGDEKSAYKNHKTKQNDLFSKFFSPFVIVLPDKSKVFNKLDYVTLTNIPEVPTKKNVFNFFELLFIDKVGDDPNILSLNDSSIFQIETIIVTGLFQLVLLLASLVTIIALMMAIFFRTLENLEKGVHEYIIAKQIGLTQKQAVQSLFIEAFITQILPFVLGSVVSIIMLVQIVIPRANGKVKLNEILFEPQSIIIFSSIIAFLVILLITLLTTTIKKINETKVT